MVRFIKSILPVFLAASLVLVTAGCMDDPQVNVVAEKERQPPTTASPKMSYDQYRQLYKVMSANLILPGVKKVEDFTQRGYLAFVESELTFGKRNVLTRTGEQTDEMTQSKIAYEGDGIAVYLDLIYLEQSLSNDMVFIEGGTKYFKDHKFQERFQETILSYKNTLLRIGIYSTSEKPIPNGLLNDFGKSVVSFLKDQRP